MPYDKLERPHTTAVGTGVNLAAGAAVAMDTVDDMGGAGLTIGAKLGIGGTATGTLDVKVQESATGTGSWTDVAGGAFAQESLTHAATTANPTGRDPQRIAFRNTKRYLRMIYTVVTGPFNGVTVAFYPIPGMPGGFNARS